MNFKGEIKESMNWKTIGNSTFKSTLSPISLNSTSNNKAKNNLMHM